MFDLDTDKLKALYYNTSWNNAYKDIEKVLVKEGFKRQQESVYFGDKSENYLINKLKNPDMQENGKIMAEPQGLYLYEVEY